MYGQFYEHLFYLFGTIYLKWEEHGESKTICKSTIILLNIYESKKSHLIDKN